MIPDVHCWVNCSDSMVVKSMKNQKIPDNFINIWPFESCLFKHFSHFVIGHTVKSARIHKAYKKKTICIILMATQCVWESYNRHFKGCYSATKWYTLCCCRVLQQVLEKNNLPAGACSLICGGADIGLVVIYLL